MSVTVNLPLLTAIVSGIVFHSIAAFIIGFIIGLIMEALCD